MKTALVTGANKGIGFEVARQLTTRGWRVFVGARQREAGLRAAESLGANAEFSELDVVDETSIRQAVVRVSKRTDRLDVLVNNAGIVEDRDENALTVGGDIVLRTFTTNALGALRVTQVFHPLLAKSDAPCIINVSSGAGQLSDPGTWAPAYSISKTALNGVTVQLAGALTGFTVNAVCPGWVRTDMGGSAAPRSVEQGADTIVWLATEAPRDLTGKFLRDRQVIPW